MKINEMYIIIHHMSPARNHLDRKVNFFVVVLIGEKMFRCLQLSNKSWSIPAFQSRYTRSRTTVLRSRLVVCTWEYLKQWCINEAAVSEAVWQDNAR